MIDQAEVDRLFARLRRNVGVHCLRFKEYNKAYINFQESLTLAPERLDTLYLYAQGKTRDGKPDEALKILNVKKAELCKF